MYYCINNIYRKFVYYFFEIKEHHLGSRFKYKYRNIKLVRHFSQYKIIKNFKNNISSLSKIYFIKKPFFEKKRIFFISFLRKDKFYLKSVNQRVRQICQNTVYFCLSLLLISVIMSSGKLYFFEKNFFDMNYFFIFLYFLNFYIIFKFNIIKVIKNIFK